MRFLLYLYTGLFFCVLEAHQINEKVLICGVAKNVEQWIPATIESASLLGEHFLDYRVVIYENNSTDRTKWLLKEWQQHDPHVIVTMETLNLQDLVHQFVMGVYSRCEAIAYARNRVLDLIMQPAYEDYKYVIWADLDMPLWDIPHIIETIVSPQQEWDAVFANGSYDLFAWRDPEFPIGFELLGDRYWCLLDEMRRQLNMTPDSPWRPVYSAFGGLGIYKRQSIKGCRYSGVVTADVERAVISWLRAPSFGPHICFYPHYAHLQKTAPWLDLDSPMMHPPVGLPREFGIRLHPPLGLGQVAWFSCTPHLTLPAICEHIPFHASMALRGHGKLFINPKIRSEHP